MNRCPFLPHSRAAALPHVGAQRWRSFWKSVGVMGLIIPFVLAVAQAQGLPPPVRTTATPPTQQEKFHLYLLAGQSNMAGRGSVEAQDTVAHRRVLRLNKQGEWELAQAPLHFDKPIAGVGPGLTFGRALAAQDTSIVIGLIPCAVGGSPIASWQPAALDSATRTHPYDEALARAKIARHAGTLMGIIWHQGESDSKPGKSVTYERNLAAVIARFRRDLQAPHLPFVAGQLPPFQLVNQDSAGRPQPNEAAIQVNAAIAHLVQQVPYYGYVSAQATKDRGDRVHFDAASARRMGRRYAQAMRELLRKDKSKPRP